LSGQIKKYNAHNQPEVTMMRADSRADTNLRIIPGVGRRIAQDLIDLGYHNVSDLRGEDPQSMYKRLCELRGVHIDRCMLYVFRCAAYFAANTVHDPDKLKWWNWKDIQAGDARPGARTSLGRGRSGTGAGRKRL
jgi:hypothetical protein